LSRVLDIGRHGHHLSALLPQQNPGQSGGLPGGHYDATAAGEQRPSAPVTGIAIRVGDQHHVFTT
jgi:hypothetical protein